VPIMIIIIIIKIMTERTRKKEINNKRTNNSRISFLEDMHLDDNIYYSLK